LEEYASTYILNGRKRQSGERGFYMEAQLGGIIKAKHDGKGEIERLILDDSGIFYEVGDPDFDQFYQDIVIKDDFRPLQHSSTPLQEDMPDENLKGRSVQDSHATHRNGCYKR